MTQVWFGSDFHWGHKNIGKFRAPFISSEEENRTRIQEDWKQQVGKRDDVYLLGDFCFDVEMMEQILDMPGQRKFLVRGNHDEFDLGVYAKYFHNIYGIKKYKDFWLSHAPIHPDELRGKINLHGHVHYASICKPFNPISDVTQEEDQRYFNCCPENLWLKFKSSLVSLDQIRKYYDS
jgi:calcineurin-like phosphoesterase family protein